MRLKQITEKKWLFPLLAFLIPFFGMTGVLIVSQYAPFGTHSILYSDMYHQYYPFFLEFRESLLSGTGLQWTWSVGMGVDYLGLIAYYVASPLNLLTVLLPKSLMLTYFSFLQPIKLGLAGLFFALFLKKVFDRNDWSISLFGALYATCAWALGYQWNIMWMDTFAMLPLVMLGMLSLLEKRKFLLYTFSLFIAVLSNYYIGLFVCIFVFLSFIAYEICRFKSIQKLIVDLFLMGVFSLLALGMTLILELPAYAALQNTQSSVNNFPKEFRLNMVTEHNMKGLLKAMKLVAGNMNGGIVHSFKQGLPNLYCGVGTIVLAFLFLTCKQVKIRDKICSVLLLLFFMVSCIIRQLDYIWHGFHFTNMIPYRFTFLFSFVMLYMAYRAFLLRRSFKLWQVITASILSVFIVFCYKEKTDYVYLIFNLVLLTLYISTHFYQAFPFPSWKKRSTEERETLQVARNRLCSLALAGTISIELILNLVNYGLNFGGASVANYPKGTTDTAQAIAFMKELEKDNLFYRTEVTHTQTLNDGALNNYDGVSAFTSSAYVNVTLFMQALGYGAKNTYNRYAFEESSPVANLFLNLRYMLERDGKVEANSYFDTVKYFGKVALLQNNAYLPLGFLANSALADVEFKVFSNRFNFQNNLITAATGVGPVWSTVDGSALQIVGGKGATVNSVNATGYCNYSSKEKGTVTFSYSPTEEGLFCIDLTLSKKNSYTVKLNGKTLFSETYSLPQMIAVCDVVPGDRVDIVFNCKANEFGSINVKNGLLNQRLFRQAHSILEASTLELTEFDTTYMAGTINCNRDGLLYTSIPQTGNWVATVDGKEVETVKIGDAMLGVYLTEGEHTLTFTYRNEALKIGAIASGACLITVVVLWIIFYKPYQYLDKLRKK